jgi:glycosyltransferase involved in cell wall biosynthesis
MKRLLFYNWCRLDDLSSSGGVGVYTRNLISTLIKNPNYVIFYLNAGFSYTLDGKLRIRKTANQYGESVRSFEVVNSPVIAPSPGQSIKNIKQYLEDTSLHQLLKDWIIAIGGIDVIHFQNLEGLSLKVLNLKKDFPNTRFVYSLHNYFPICPSVNLWHSDHNCDRRSFVDCVNCLRRRRYTTTKIARVLNNSKVAEGINYYSFQEKPSQEDAFFFEKFYMHNRLSINRTMDNLLAVSNRVNEIFTNHGYDENKIQTSYIGSRVADKRTSQSNAISSSKPFKIIFMGYMNAYKGFYFLINALKALPDTFAKDIHVTICARYSLFSQIKDLNEIRRLKKKFYGIDLIKGYNSTNQQHILQGMHLGLVPVLWEDNLPQVLIEQIAYGVPVLCSDLGGGKEIVNNPDFTFKANDIEDFNKKLINIYSNRSILRNFWQHVQKLTSLEEHINFLNATYNQ